MRRFSFPTRCLALAFVLGWSLSHSSVFGQNDPAKEPSKASVPAEKIRRALDQVLVVDYQGQSLEDALRHLKEKTQVTYNVDQFALQGLGIPGNEVQVQVSLKGNGIKVRQALQRMLTPLGLTFVILDDSVLVTTENYGIHRQLMQHTQVDAKEVTVQKALRDLAKQTGVPLVIDPRVLKQAEAKVSLEVEDTTVETAMRLVAELGDLKAVRMGNVIFVTDPARAKGIREEQRDDNGTPMIPGIGINDAIRNAGVGGVGGFGGIGGFAPAAPGGTPMVVPAPPAPPPEKDDAPTPPRP